MNIAAERLLNRPSPDFSDSTLNTQKTPLANLVPGVPDSGGAKSILFGSPASSDLPGLSPQTQESAAGNGGLSSAWDHFIQRINSQMQSAGSLLTSLVQQVNKAHAAETETKTEASADSNAPAVNAAESSSGAAAVSSDADIDPRQNSMTFENKGDKPMTLSFTPNADGSAKPEDLILQPGETKTQKFDANWSGNFRSTAGDGANVTLGEVKFDGGSGQTYYDVSYIEGNNAAMTIGPAKGDGRVSGTLDDLVSGAPDGIKAKDAEGNVYGLKKSTTAEQQDPAVVNYYRQHVAADKGYVIPSDNESTLGSSSKNLKVELKG